MKTIKDLLLEKGQTVYTIPPEATVYEALTLMAEKNLGALVVYKNDAVVGLFSERDYARKIALKGKFSKEVRVDEIMTSRVISINQKMDIESCMKLMHNNHIRHLPVIDDYKLTGLISIGDIVKAIIEHKEEIITDLEGYITGKR